MEETGGPVRMELTMGAEDQVVAAVVELAQMGMYPYLRH